jgi:xanthine/uracil permease
MAIIAAMITPALLIMASSSLVASALARMARIVDRARALATLLQDGQANRMGVTPAVLRRWLEAHAVRARYAEWSIAVLYAAVVVFVSTCLSIALDRVLDGAVTWLPIALAVIGTTLLLAGGALMVAESRLSGRQIQDEIRYALARTEQHPPSSM